MGQGLITNLLSRNYYIARSHSYVPCLALIILSVVMSTGIEKAYTHCINLWEFDLHV